MSYLFTTDKNEALEKSLREPCRVASIAPIVLANVITALDDVTLVNGNRVLLKDQASGVENGIYRWNSGTQKLTLAPDWNTIFDGIKVGITEGTVNKDTTWLLTTNDPIEVGVTSISFAQIKWIIGAGVAGNSNSSYRNRVC